MKHLLTIALGFLIATGAWAQDGEKRDKRERKGEARKERRDKKQDCGKTAQEILARFGDRENKERIAKKIREHFKRHKDGKCHCRCRHKKQRRAGDKESRGDRKKDRKRGDKKERRKDRRNDDN